MNVDVKTAFDDLAGAADLDVDLEAIAARSWSIGRRRRRNRAVAAVAATVVLIGGIGALVATSPFSQRAVPPAANSGSGADGYPERIGHQWSMSGLPDRSSAISLLLEGDPSASVPSWYAVDANGHRWTVPTAATDARAAISADGRQIGYLERDSGPYVIHNVASGAYLRFPGVGTSAQRPGSAAGGPRIVLAQGRPAFWSPGGDRVAMAGSRSDGTGTVVVLATDGSTQVLAEPGVLAGWSGGNLAFVVRGPATPPATSRPVNVRLVAPDGSLVRTVSLAETLHGSPQHWQVSTSPQGRSVALVRTNAFKVTFVGTFSLATGKQIGETSEIAKDDVTCPTAWMGETPVLPTFTNADQPTDVPVAVHGKAVNRLLVVDPSVQASCMLFSSDALSGHRVDSLFGLSKSWFSWWWKEIVLGALVVLVLLAAGIRANYVLRERRAMRAVSHT